MVAAWVCPHCHLALAGETVLRCANNHSFDVAREGYVNLLVGRGSAQKGDTLAMLTARRRFLEAGHYEPLRRRLAGLVRRAQARVVAEAGCGEGYYLGGISEASPSASCFGMDVAKDGVRLAARSYRSARFAVADTYQPIPLPEAGVDVLLNIFAPRNPAEFARVIRPAGSLIVVIPTERHLAELRELLPLGIQADKRATIEASLAGRFQLQQAETLTVPLELDEQALADLIGMTPNAWFMDKQGIMPWPTGQVTVTAEFEILSFRR